MTHTAGDHNLDVMHEGVCLKCGGTKIIPDVEATDITPKITKQIKIMAKKTLTIDASAIEVSAGTNYAVGVLLDGVNPSEVLNHFSAEEVALHFDHDDLLDEIPLDVVLKHFDLESANQSSH